MVINSNGKTAKGDNVIILNSKDYEYVWSINHERNSGIKDSLYPSNYINAVKQALNTGKDIVIDINESIKLEFKKAGIPVVEEV